MLYFNLKVIMNFLFLSSALRSLTRLLLPRAVLLIKKNGLSVSWETFPDLFNDIYIMRMNSKTKLKLT